MPRKSSTTNSLYTVHPSVAYAQTVIANLPANTGKSMGQWNRLLAKSGLNDSNKRRDWLKKEHKLGGTTATMIAEASTGKTLDADAYLVAAAGYVETMYAGPKSVLRPIHDALIDLGLALGKDVKVCPCQTIVPLYRHHVFAQIKPTTRTRIDFGLALKGMKTKIPDRLIATGGLEKGDRITHRMALSAVEQVDAVVKQWARIAYELDADA